MKMKLSGQKLTLEQSLLAVGCDFLQLMNMPTKKQRRHYKSIYKQLTEDSKKDELEVFESVEDFEVWYKNKMR